MKRLSSDKTALPGGSARSALLYLLIFILLAEGIVVVGYLSFKHYEQNYFARAEEQLAAITELKASGLSQWRQELLGDGDFLFKNPAFSIFVRRLIYNPENTSAQRHLQTWLGKYEANPRYDRIRLLDTQGVTRISSPAGLLAVSSVVAEHAAEALRSDRVMIQDFYRSENDGQIRLALLIPVFDGPDTNTNQPLGVLTMRIDPSAYLYPFLKSWPVPSETAETLLVRREGNEAVFLNELRFQTNAALNLRMPLDRVEVPAVQAVLGNRGVMKGIDYRGVPVIACTQPIPDSPWFIVARRDVAEVAAEMNARLWQTIAMIVSLIFCAATGVALVWRQQRVGFYREKARAAETLRESERKLKQAQEVARLGSYELDVRSGDWTCSEMLDNLFGINPSYPKNIAGWSQLLHPDDRKAMMAYFLNHVVMGKNPFDREYRIVRQKDKAVRWVHGLGQLRCDAGGEVIAMFGVIQDITERRQAEEALHREQDFQRALLDNIAEGVVACDAKGTLTLFNRVAREWHGMDALSLPPEEWGRHYNLYGPDGTTPLPTEDIPLLRAFRGETVRNAEMTIVAKGRPPRAILASGCSFFDAENNLLGAVAVMHDITGRKQAEEIILRERDFSQAVLDSLPGLFYLFDERGRFLRWNKHFEEVSGYSADEVSRMIPLNFFNKMDGQNVADTIQRVFQTGEATVEAGFLSKDQARTSYLFTGKRFQFDQKPCVVGMGVDITLRKLADDRLIAIMRDLRTSNQDLEQFAYVASHDLQEPLRMVASYMQLIDRRYKDKFDQNARDFIGFAVDGAVRMQKLIDSLLEYSRVQSRKKPFDDVDLGALLKQVLRDLEKQVLEVGARITADPLPSVFGDALQLGLVFQNLIGNALKFRGEKAPEVHIAAEEFSKHWKITVRDNGIGIAPEYQGKIFKIFQRLHNQSEYPGTGIGLAVCRRVIERHGGEIGLESEVGKGSSFWFTLLKKGEK